MVEPEIERPVSRLSRKRSFRQSSCGEPSSLRREFSIHGSESGLDAMVEDSDDSDEGGFDIGEIVQLTYREFQEAAERKKCKIQTRIFEPALYVIYEVDETALESEQVKEAELDDKTEEVDMVEQDQVVQIEENELDRHVQNGQLGQDTQDGRKVEIVEQEQIDQDDQMDQDGDQDCQKNDQVEQQDDHNDQLGQSAEIDQKVETVEQDENDRNQDGQNAHLDLNGQNDQDQKGHQRISSGTHTISGPSDSETTLHNSNERQYQEANVQTVVSMPQSTADDLSNSKWKKRFHRFSEKTRNALRTKDTEFSLLSESAGSSEFTASSPTSNCDPNRQHVFSFDSPRDESEKPFKTSSTKRLATKVKSVLSKSSSVTAVPEKKYISFSDFFYGGIWVFGSPMVMV